MNSKPYFCPRCGTPYHYRECLHYSHRLTCRRCPGQQVAISGWPLVFVGMALGIFFVIYRILPFDTKGGHWIFLPAAGGMIAVGLLRLAQAWRASKNPPPMDEGDMLPDESPHDDKPAEAATPSEPAVSSALSALKTPSQDS